MNSNNASATRPIGTMPSPRLVKTGKAVGDRMEVLSGLADGERVVAGGAERVADGDRVEATP